MNLKNELDRNLKGKEFEKLGEIDKAIELYEQNVSLESCTPHPYKRLSLIYKKQGKFDDEIRVLKSAIAIMEIEAKRYKWLENSKQYEKILDFKSQLIKAYSKKK